MDPLLGSWAAVADSPQGRVRCKRTFTRILGGSRLQLLAQWKFGETTYEELAVYGPGMDGVLAFWSFTTDGKQSQGTLADVRDLHPEAVGFHARMPVGLARMAYWPEAGGGFVWVVEAKTKKGWKRFTERHYKKA
jgi:hypothetical protein